MQHQPSKQTSCISGRFAWEEKALSKMLLFSCLQGNFTERGKSLVWVCSRWDNLLWRESKIKSLRINDNIQHRRRLEGWWPWLGRYKVSLSNCKQTNKAHPHTHTHFQNLLSGRQLHWTYTFLFGQGVNSSTVGLMTVQLSRIERIDFQFALKPKVALFCCCRAWENHKGCEWNRTRPISPWNLLSFPISSHIPKMECKKKRRSKESTLTG